MAEFKKGDVVQLKSGGPRMTVADVGDFGPIGPENGVNCVWFDKSKQYQKSFDADTLELSGGHGIGSVSIGRS